MIKAVVYTSTGCVYCDKIKAFLSERSIPYEERNVLTEPSWAEELTEQGLFTTPVLFLDDEPIVGYRPQKMAQILERLQGGAAPDTSARG